ncbi:hypothetical protein A4U88_3198 [Serratia marcescens]|nr:hypothetical protein A4U88_3198 [Serratia marcescens]
MRTAAQEISFLCWLSSVIASRMNAAERWFASPYAGGDL